MDEDVHEIAYEKCSMYCTLYTQYIRYCFKSPIFKLYFHRNPFKFDVIFDTIEVAKVSALQCCSLKRQRRSITLSTTFGFWNCFYWTSRSSNSILHVLSMFIQNCVHSWWTFNLVFCVNIYSCWPISSHLNWLYDNVKDYDKTYTWNSSTHWCVIVKMCCHFYTKQINFVWT